LLTDPAGSPGASGASLEARVYAELRRIAAAKLRLENGRMSLRTTDVVHETWLRLRDQRGLDWENRDQFACLAARAIRRILVDHARARSALKRSPTGERVFLSVEFAAPPHDELDVLALDDALARFAEKHERAARVVELRFFAGMTEAEAARALGLAERTVAGDWAFARAWLRRALGPGGGS
jgi:RNA polymerase sigma-70 factor (ECF subfamily)